MLVELQKKLEVAKQLQDLKGKCRQEPQVVPG